jgi:valyl-tRNA synthetase
MRTIKSTYNLKAQAKPEGEAAGQSAGETAAADAGGGRLQFLIKALDPAVRQVLLAQRPLIEMLTRAELVDVVEEVAGGATKGTIAQVAPGLVVLLLHADTLIDAPAELLRLQKEAAKVDKELATLRGRLQNADFVARAKPEIVDQNRARVLELEQRLSELVQHQQTIATMV